MNEFFTCLFSTNGMAYGSGVLIFLITLFLTSRKIIGFTLTLLFLIFALAASLAVAHQDLVRSYLENYTKEKTTGGTYQGAGNTPAQSQTPSKTDINADIQKTFDEIKDEVLIQKDKLQKLWDEYTAKKAAEPKTQNPQIQNPQNPNQYQQNPNQNQYQQNQYQQNQYQQ